MSETPASHGGPVESGAGAALAYPIAAPYRLMALEADAAAGVQRLFDVLEMTLRTLASFVLAELAAHERKESARPFFERPLSTGAVHGWLRETLPEAAALPNAAFSRALAPIHLAGTGGARMSQRLDELIAARNRTRGHGVTLSPHQYRKLRAELLPKLEAVLTALAPLTAFRPVIVKGMNDYDGRSYEHQVFVATGDHPYFPVDVLRTNVPLAFRRVHLVGPGRSLVSLHPFLVHETCPHCEEDHLFLLQSAHSDKLQYVDALKGCVLVTHASRTLLDSAGDRTSHPAALSSGEAPGPATVGPGFELGGRYVLVRELGRGAGGEVHAAEDRLTGLQVAVKILRLPGNGPLSQPASEPRVLVERFQREARLAGQLRHPSAVQVFDVGVDRGLHYFAMELVEGEQLRARLARGPLPLEEALSIANQILGVLAVAHEAGIVHRDLKPENVLLRSDGTAKLADFGVARLMGSTTITTDGQVIGTMGYMAPEQVEGRAVDARTDLFAVGVLLFEMATGMRPFRGATVRETLAAILTADPPRPSQVAPELPAWLDDVMLRLLAKSPAERPANAAEAVALLGRRDHRPDAAAPAWRRLLSRPRPRLALEHLHPLEVEGLSFAFGRKRVLHGLSLDLARGSRMALLGRNGAGKTTLTACVMGLHRPDRGVVRLFGTSRVSRSLTHRHVGYIPESPTACSFMSVGRFLDHLARLQPLWDRRWALELAHRFELPLDQKLRSLSRGQQTMVSLVAAFGHRPPLLVFDDPTLGLDAFWVQEFVRTVAELTEQRGMSVLFATHDFEAVEAIADRVGFLADGRVRMEMDVQEASRRFCNVELVLPDDEEPIRLPRGLWVAERRKRTLSGVYQLDGQRPEDAFAFLRPASFATSAPSLRDVYFHVLQSSAADRGGGAGIASAGRAAGAVRDAHSGAAGTPGGTP